MVYPENCAVANYTERYGSPQVWGFADANCGIMAPFICRISGGAGYVYNSTTNQTFIFTPAVKNFTDAEQSCQDQGGHLASYSSEAEQAEVEKYYVSQGYMFPSFPGHAFYWLGLNTSHWPSTGFPNFYWLDRSPGPNSSTYSHWGTYYDSYSASPEPNNARAPPETCAGANVTEAYGNLSAWGWADYHCGEKFGFMCKMIRGWQLPVSLGVIMCCLICHAIVLWMRHPPHLVLFLKGAISPLLLQLPWSSVSALSLPAAPTA
jgi:hypothetical protein